MTFDLILGFPQRPAHLGDTLDALGFTLERVVPKEEIFGVTMEYYEYFDANVSRSGVYLVYHDGTYPDHQSSWANMVENPNSIVATGSLTCSVRRSTFDSKKQHEVGRFLRDYYKAVLYDPQSGTMVLD